MGALPRRLPISVPPAPHEIVASYLARLATLNSHDGDQLWRRISTPGPTPARRIVRQAGNLEVASHEHHRNHVLRTATPLARG